MDFAEKLELAMKTLSLSRAGLAAEIGVDKSVAGRWVAGKVKPSAHNIAKISRLIAEQVPGFTMLDWDREFADFSRVLGAELTAPSPQPDAVTSLMQLLPENLASEARFAAQERSKAYEGIWRTTRPSSDLPGQFLHDIAIVRRNPDGVLVFDSGVEGVYYSGTTIQIQQQLFYFAADDTFGAVSMGIFNGVSRARAEVVDGVLLTTLRDAGASPTASSIVMERLHDLTDDFDADTKTFQSLVEKQKLIAPPGSVDPEIADHLHGAANAPGMLRMLFAQSISRGPRLRS